MESQELADVHFTPQPNPFLKEEMYYERYPDTEGLDGYIGGAAAIGIVALIFISVT